MTTLLDIAQRDADGKLLLKQKSVQPNVDGYDMVLKNGLLYHVHPTATLEYWDLIQQSIATAKAHIEPWTPPPAPSVEELTAIYTSELQIALDVGAKAWGYDNIFTAASYATSTVPRFRTESAALIAWRDETWVWAAARLAAITSGIEPMPTTPAELVAMMPARPTRPQP